MALLELEKVNKHFGGLQAVADVDLCVEKGRVHGIIGPNGAGKTTLFNLIAGSLPLSSGTVLFLDQPISGLKPYQIARRGIFRTFQAIKLCAHMSVVENVMLGRHVRTKSGIVRSILKPPATRREEREIREYSMELLSKLDIADLAPEEATSLPFGKQRAVELARTLAADPVLLLLDEPASGLTIHETDDLSRLICDIRDMGVTILLVEHDMSLVMEICDKLAVLNFGRKIAEGSPAEIQRNREVIDIYLGEDHA